MVFETIEAVEVSTPAEESPAVSWAAVVAGAIATAALTLVLLAFGAGMGFSAISPWGNSGVSASTFSNWYWSLSDSRRYAGLYHWRLHRGAVTDHVGRCSCARSLL